MMQPQDNARLAAALLSAVLAAGALIMRHRSAGVIAETKADSSPVTIADQEAEHVILEALARHAPGVPVIAEEAASRGDRTVPAREFFLVDPLDGTKDYVRGGTDFTINIGLVHDGVPCFGLIYAPAIGQLAVTLDRSRAVETQAVPTEEAPDFSALALTDMRTREPAPDRLVGVASRSHRTPRDEAFKADPRIARYRTIGSSLKFLLVARGEADIYPRFGPTCEWDTAAGHAIVLAAGGEVTAIGGGPLLYGKSAANYINPPFVVWGRASLVPQFSL